MTKMTGADIVVRALEDEGIAFSFGIPGTHNIELYDSFARSGKVRVILVTDEQSASFMADGVARSSGRLAAVNVVPGAGLTHALSGIAEASWTACPCSFSLAVYAATWERRSSFTTWTNSRSRGR